MLQESKWLEAQWMPKKKSVTRNSPRFFFLILTKLILPLVLLLLQVLLQRVLQEQLLSL